MLRTVLIIIIAVCLLALAIKVASAEVPECGQSPLDAPPNTAGYCDELPPPGFHAGVGWQSDEFSPGLEAEIVEKLKLESYYNWQLEPRSEYKPWEPEYFDLATKHIPMFYDPLDPDFCERYPVCMMPTRCEFILVWNEPDARTEANATPGEVAYFNHRFARQQKNLCYQDQRTNFGSMGTLLVDLDAWGGGAGPIRSGYVTEYIEHGGPVPDAWTIHIYTDTWEDWLAMWDAVDYVLETSPEYDRPVIVTEAACVHPDMEERKRCITNMAALVESEPRLHSIYWFVAEGWIRYDESFTFTKPGTAELTELGEHFMRVRGYAPNHFIGVLLIKEVDEWPSSTER